MSLQAARLSSLSAEINEATPAEAFDRSKRGAVLLDVREPSEIAEGSPVGAVRITRAFLEFRIEAEIPDPDTELLVICASGGRSLFVAESLLGLGYRDVATVKGGVREWRDNGLPMEIPRVLTGEERERYSRHLLIPQVGEKGQLRLLSSRVALVGVGGLGSPVAYYLAAAGVGALSLIDDDRVERSNLQRQILHSDDRIGTAKAVSGAGAVTRLNPQVKVETHEVRLTSENVEDILRGHDLVIDGSDNLATRYLVNDACVRLGIPEVYGAIFQFEGELSVFWPGYPKRRGPCYRCLFPEPPPGVLAPSCAEAGVLGVVPGIIGTLMAAEGLKVLLGRGVPLIGRLLRYDSLAGRFSELRVDPDPDCSWCGEKAHAQPYVDYAAFCASR